MTFRTLTKEEESYKSYYEKMLETEIRNLEKLKTEAHHIHVRYLNTDMKYPEFDDLTKENKVKQNKVIGLIRGYKQSLSYYEAEYDPCKGCKYETVGNCQNGCGHI